MFGHKAKPVAVDGEFINAKQSRRVIEMRPSLYLPGKRHGSGAIDLLTVERTLPGSPAIAH